MDKNYKGKDRPTIRMLCTMFGNDEGDTVKISSETDEEIYYTDGFGRWCYLLKKDEGKDFEWVKRPK
jgi:hypothetical protein